MSTSLKEAIEAKKAKVAEVYSKVEEKGGTMPSSKDLAHLAEAVESIKAGGGDYYVTFNDATTSFRLNKTVTSVKFNAIDNATSTYQWFYSCTSLESATMPSYIPLVTNVSQMFSGCTNLVGKFDMEIPLATDASGMFSSTKVEEVKLNMPKCSNINSILRFTTTIKRAEITTSSEGCNIGLTFAGCTDLEYAHIYCKASAIAHENIFQGCPNLKDVHMPDLSLATSLNRCFLQSNCEHLEVEALPNISLNNVGFNSLTKLDHDSVVNIINALPTTTSGYTCTLGAVNLAKLTNEEKAIATSKGWTLN